MIKELRGITRSHLVTVKGCKVYLETCHSASPTDKRAFATNGSRFVVVLEDKSEMHFRFPEYVEEFVENKIRKEL